MEVTLGVVGVGDVVVGEGGVGGLGVVGDECLECWDGGVEF